MTSSVSKHKRKNDNSLSETAPFDKKTNWSLEVEMASKANEDALAQSSERRSQREFLPENSAHLSPRKESRGGVALVCDWLTTPGGAEKVLLELHRMYPDAPIYTSQYSKKGINWFNDATVKTGWLRIFPRGLRKFLGPLRQLYFSHLDLSSYDLVISVTGAEAKSVRTKHIIKNRIINTDPNNPKKLSASAAETIKQSAYHLCYCHVPTQYYWQMYDKYVDNPGFGILNPLVRTFFKLLVKPLRKADYQAAQQPDQFVTISNYAQQQIQQYYNRKSVIVPPNVDVTKFRPKSSQDQDFHHKTTTFPQESPQKSTTFPQNQPDLSAKAAINSTSNPQTATNFSTRNPQKSTETDQLSTDNPQVFHKFSTSFPQVSKESPDAPQGAPGLFAPGNYYIISCRQVTWKRVDLAIESCRELKVPLLVVGDGSEHQNLVKLANNSPYIKFLPWAKPEELAEYLQNARAYLFPSLEPFGIAAVEALAAGCPVIAYAEGGSRDIVQPGENGLLFSKQTPASLIEAIKKFQTFHFDREKISRSANRFDTKHFREGIKHLVSEALKSQSDSPTSTPNSKSSTSKGPQ